MTHGKASAHVPSGDLACMCMLLFVVHFIIEQPMLPLMKVKGTRCEQPRSVSPVSRVLRPHSQSPVLSTGPSAVSREAEAGALASPGMKDKRER